MEHTENKSGDSGININTPTAVIIAGTIIAVAIIFSNGFKSNRPAGTAGSPSAQRDTKEIVLAPITDKDHFYGNPNSKVVMIEFSDTECPFCKVFHSTAQKIVDDSNGDVSWVYRHFPLDALHSKARKEAEATECVAELGGNDKFWEYLGLIFKTTPANDGLDPAELPKMAVQIGVNKSKFEACLSSGKYKNLVELNYQDGLKAGVTGTPTTFIINRKGEKIVLVGAQPEEKLKEAINSLIK